MGLSRLGIVVILLACHSVAAAEAIVQGGEVFIRFAPGTIADPSQAESGAVWNTDDFDPKYWPLLDAVAANGIQGLRPIGLSWRPPQSDMPRGQRSPSEFVDFSTVYVGILEPDAAPHWVAERLGKLSEIEYAEVPGMGTFQGGRYTEGQWWMETTGQTTPYCIGAGILECDEDIDSNIPEAWAVADSSDALVAILDSGVFTGGAWWPVNQDLADSFNQTISHDFTGAGLDDCYPYHGSNVAGLVAGECENPQQPFEGVVGFTSPSGWDPLVVMRVGQSYAWSELAATDALDYICNPTSPAYGRVKIATMSLGTGEPGNTLADAMRNAYLDDIALFAASGNVYPIECHDNLAIPYPAAFLDYVHAVAHVRCDGSRWPYPSGNYIDLAAPGGSHIETTAHNNSTEPCFGGTSASSPIAAGIASLLRGYAPSLTNDDIYAVMNIGTLDLGEPGYDVEFGNGLIRADLALQVLAEDEDHAAGVQEVGWISAVVQVDSLVMRFRNTPLRLGSTSWARVYLVTAEFSLEPGVGRVISGCWARSRECWTVRGPDDLYHLDCQYGALPFFDDKRLGQWGEVEHVSGNDYVVRGYVYHIFDDSSLALDRGWFPFNPFGAVPDPVFTVAYIDAPQHPARCGPHRYAGVHEQLPGREELGRELSFTVGRAGSVSLAIYDVGGRLVWDAGERYFSAGSQTWHLDFEEKGAATASGVYFARLRTPTGLVTTKFAIMR